MSPRTSRIALWTFTALCGAGAALSVGIAAVAPLDRGGDGAAARGQLATHAGTTQPSAGTTASMASSDPLWDMSLRRPLVDAPAPPPSAPVAAQPAIDQAPPPPHLHLVGTIVEPGHSIALFQGAAGRTEFKAIGDAAEGAKVVSIREDGATVLWDGREIVVPIEGGSATGPAKQTANHAAQNDDEVRR